MVCTPRSAGRSAAVFGIGQCSLDYLGRIGAYPHADTKCEFTGLTIQGGGPVATALVALSRWGVPCTFAGVVGDDRFGRQIIHSLEQEGICTEGILVREGAGSQFAFIAVEVGSGRRTVFWRRPTGEPPRPGEVDLAPLRSADALLTDGLFADASLAAAAAARERGVAVVVDGGSLREGMTELASRSDHFIASESFARSLVGRDDPAEACRRLARLGPAVTAVTLGKRGYAALAEGRYFERPARAVEAVDTTGCGDVFHGGYVYGLLAGWETERRLDFASWAASRASLALGGRAGIPAREEYDTPPLR